MEYKPLCDGFTTGTCAAAAAKAAAVLLCRKRKPAVNVEAGSIYITIQTPAGILAKLEAETVAKNHNRVSCRVQKDAGDDPDITNRAWIEAEVEWLNERDWSAEVKQNRGFWLAGFPLYYLTGGRGVGTVTKRGLSCPVGTYAINPVPREMIIKAAAEVFSAAGIANHTVIRISVPDGEALAAQTFNPRLGIYGGISIIGTSGIVKPMSDDALRETIRLELRVKAAATKSMVFIVPGNYGEAFLYSVLHIPKGEAVSCSNFIAETMQYAADMGISRVLLAGHIGKLIKVAGGAGNTHSRYGDKRMELLSGFTAKFDEHLAVLVRSANTTEEAIGILNRKQLAGPVLTQVAKAVKRQAEEWTEHRLNAEAVTFSSVHGICGKTDRVAAWVKEWNRKEGVESYETGCLKLYQGGQ